MKKLKCSLIGCLLFLGILKVSASQMNVGGDEGFKVASATGNAGSKDSYAYRIPLAWRW